MVYEIFFALWRILQIITLIPIVGMLAYFVDGYQKANALTPNYILILFIVSVLAVVWAIFTIFSYHRSSSHAMFVATVDLLFVGAFIGAVYTLRFITDADCTHISPGSAVDITFGIFGSASINGLDVKVDKTCAMLKAAFAFGIINAILFFFTSILAFLHGNHHHERRDTHYVRSTTQTHHSHSRSRNGSHHSHHSHRRSYV
ncbi:hypothetical protein GGR57DRAFT_456191 [Xylariaceae sp. FL1272]|nr:hypothetical protein GGR57DRAFT_456191 [Xylariaceae sp. FL1272]